MGQKGIFELGGVGAHSYLELESSDLDVSRLNHAWQRLIARHEMLRTIILADGRQQVLEKIPPYEVEVTDLREETPEAVRQRLEALRQQLSHRIQEPEGWPLIEIRASLLPGGRTRLHLNVNALVVDAWSLQILARELTQLVGDPEAELPPLTLSFRDYVLGEEAVRRSPIYQRSEQYWRQRLSTLPPAPDLPLAQNPGSLGQPRFTRCSARLGPERWQRLKNQATEAALTPSGVLIAAFAEILDGWTASPRFTINLTLFNRLPLHPEVNALVGDFTSLTLLAVDAAAGNTFAERARHVQKQLWDDLDHRHVSGVKVMRELAGRERGTLRALMPVVFTSTLTQDGADRDFSSPTALGELVYNITQTPQVWLDHQIYEQDGALVFNWDTVEGLFPEGMADSMFAAYCRLLERLAEEPASWHETERQRLLPEELAQRLAPAGVDPPVADALLHTLFAEQVSRRPRQPAVIASGRTLTYQELDRRALGLARWLHAAGAGTGRLVAVVMDKGWEEVVAVLAILRAGAAYLPIAASLPQERIRHLLEAGEVDLVLTQSWVEARQEWPTDLERRCVDHEQPAAEDEPPLELAQSPEDLAYVIYTSGSTGLPKGVMIDHRGAVNTILDVNRRFAVSPGDRVLALSSLGFDLSVYDVFGTLAAGGTIVVPDAAATRDPAHWAELIHEHGVSLWNSVPALLEMLVAYVEKRPELRPRSLRLVLLSGDWIAVTLPERIKALSEGVEVISLGGATEASIWSILYPIIEVDPEWTSIPYGRAMVHQRLDVLNHALEHCPVWVRGQIHIAGIGLAKGYWGNEEQTRASFFVHPRTGERLYRTGDLGRFLPDGNIEILGREDFQVKIRGHRIELGEIETALDQHPAVKTGVVAAVGESRQSQRLVAYVVLDQQWEPDAPAPESRHEIMMDPVERLHFKLSHPGLREEPGRRSIELHRPEWAGKFAAPYVDRRSYREFSSEPLARSRLEALLSCLLEARFEGLPLPKRRYGSAGSLYPVQVYLWIKPGRVADLEPGIYYHHPGDHRLVELAPGVEIDPKCYDAANRPIFRSAAFAVFLIAQFEAIAPLYGEAARHYATLEAGLITQLLEMEAPLSGLGLCQIGRMDFTPIRDFFALEPSHVLLHSLLGGGIAPEQATLDGLRRESSDNLAFIELLHSRLQETTPVVPAAAPARETDVQAELRRFLQAKLPEYMVPSAFVFLEDLPLSPTGKVDRRALVAPRSTEASPARRVAPRSERERAIAAIWQEVLELDEVGVDDSFFELGGNSVQMVRVHGKLREVLGREVAILDLFKYPTVATLAEFLGSEKPQAETLQQVDDRAEKTRAGKDRLRRFRKRQLQSRQGGRDQESRDE